MKNDRACFLPEGVLPCSERCQKRMKTDGACFISLGWHYALTVDIRRWQLTEHIFYLRGISSCSDRCQKTMKTDRACFISAGVAPYSDGWHKMMTTDGACFIPEGYIMLWPLSEDDDNWRSMFHPSRGGGITLLWLLSWDDDIWWRCFTMLLPLSWDYNNGRSMFHTWVE